MSKNILFNFYYNWWKNIDKLIFILVLFLFLLGLFFSLVSTSIIASDKLNTNSYYFFLKHMVFVFLSFGIIIFFSFLNKNSLINISITLFLIFLFFLFLVPFMGTEIKGSKRWIDFFFFPRFQPIELLKPFFVVFLGFILSFNKIKNLYSKFFLSFFVLLPVILLLIFQPDIGQTILVTMTWLSLIFISGVNLLLFFSSFAVIASIFGYLVMYIPKFSYIKIRLLAFFDPTSENNYQSERASEAITNGGLFGRGIGEGTLNIKVPEAHTDYIFSVISEEFGILVIIFIMIVFLFLSFIIIRKIDEEIEQRDKIILLGCTTLILLQAFIHIGVNIRVLPTTGMTLPFLSYGGSSIVSTAILSGIILNITKRKIKY